MPGMFALRVYAFLLVALASLVIPCAPVANAKTIIPGRLNALYGITTGCNSCHDGTSTANAVGSNPDQPTSPLADDLQLVPGFSNNALDGSDPDPATQQNEIDAITNALRQIIDSSYAPRLSNVGTVGLSKVSGVGTNVTAVTVDSAGNRAFNGGTTGLSLSANNASFAVTGSGTSWTLRTAATFANQYGSIPVVVTSTSNEGLFHSSSRTSSVSVDLGNNLPPTTPVPEFANAEANTTKTFNLGFSDPDGDALVHSLPQATSSGGNAVSITAVGALTYTAPVVVANNFSDTIQVTIANTADQTPTGTVISTQNYTVIINALTGTNNVPVALSKTYTILEAGTATDTIATDFDVGTTLTYTSGATPVPVGTSFALPHGSITISTANVFTYTGAVNDPAGDTFTYTVTDNGGKSANGTLTFNKTAVDDPPSVVAAVAVDNTGRSSVERKIDVSSGQQVATPIDLKLFVTDPDTSKTQLRYRITRIVDFDAGPTAAATYGTFSPGVGAEVANGLMTFTNRKDVALDFLVEFRVSAPGVAPGTVPCAAASPDCGQVRVQVFLNGDNRHTPAQRVELAGSLGARYFTIPGAQGHFPTGQGQGACLNCHVAGKVTSAAPSCASNAFFNELGRRLCLIQPFQTPFGPRLDQAILGNVNGQQVTSFEPTVMLPQSVITISDGLPNGTNVGAPMTFGTGLNLDGAASTIVNVYLAGPAGEFFTFDVTNNGNGSATGQMKVKKSLAGFTGGSSITAKPLPVNSGAVRTTESGGINPALPGFYPKLTANSYGAMTVNIVKEVPKVTDDAYQTNIAPAPFVMNVTANDTQGGSIDSIEIVSGPGKGTATVVGKTIVFVSNGLETGADSITYRAFRIGAGFSATNATVALTIYDGNDAVAQPDGPYTVTVGETVLLPVLENDRGPKPTSFAIKTAPTLGTAAFVGEQISYTAVTASDQLDTFEYEVTGGGVTTSATVTVRVGKVSGAILAAATNNPQLKPVALALGDTCRSIERSTSAATADQSDLVAICNGLADQASTVGAIDAALDEIRNEEVLVAGDAAVQQDWAAAGNLLGRLDAIRGGRGRGLNFGQFNLQIDDNTLSGALIDATIEKASFDGTNPDKVDLPWGAFVAGTVSFATQDRNDREAGFDLGGVMLTAGVDYALNDKALLGLAVSLGQSITDMGADDGLSTFTSQVAAYGSFELGRGLFIDGYGGLAFNDFEMSRHISFVSGGGFIDRTAQGAFDGEMLSAALRLKYVAALGGAELESYGTLSYVAAWTDAYVETGAGGLSLAVGEQNFDALSATIGFRLSDTYKADFGTFKPYVGLAYARQLDADGRSVESRFAAGGVGAPTFIVSAESDAVNTGTVEFGFTADFVDNTSATMGFSGSFSDDGVESYQIKAGVVIPLFVPEPASDVAEPDADAPVKRKKSVKPREAVSEPETVGGDATGGGGGWNN